MRLIDVDKINWQKGVFVNPNTDEPLPIIHKIATIEMLRDWQEEVRAIPLDKVKQTRETIQKLVDNCGSDTVAALNMQGGLKATLAIIDKLIAESEKQ